MFPRLPHAAFFVFLTTAALLPGWDAPAAAAASAQETPRPAAPPAGAIPATRAEPVVPASPAKSIATQLNDAYVSVFEHVAPAVVIIDILKRGSSEGDSELFPDLFFHPPSPGASPTPGASASPGGREKEKDRAGRGGRAEEPASPVPAPVPLPPAPRRLQSSEGSGFIIQANGLILTNDHVVRDAEKITVRLKDGREFPGRLVGADRKTDIAVVKIEAGDLPTAELANSDAVRVGQIACAIGVPYNQAYTFTAGVVSAKNRFDLMHELKSYEDYIQTDAAINPGNSGGPLVDLDGKVIGMNTLINGKDRGLGFAIPSNMLREVGDQLIRAGRVARSYIGVHIRSLNDAVVHYGPAFGSAKKGVVIDEILADSPAIRSDLRQADIITEVDGVSIGSDRELQKQIVGKRVGTTVQLTVVRKNRASPFRVPVQTAELPPDEPPRVLSGPINGGETEPGVSGEDEPSPGGPSSPGMPPGAGVPSLSTPSTSSAGPLPGASVVPLPTHEPDGGPLYGLHLQELTRDVADYLKVNPGTSGVLVTDVKEGSAAERAGLQAKDVITSVDDRPVKDAAGFREALKAGDPRRGIMCHVDRSGAKVFAVLKGE